MNPEGVKSIRHTRRREEFRLKIPAREREILLVLAIILSALTIATKREDTAIGCKKDTIERIGYQFLCLNEKESGILFLVNGTKLSLDIPMLEPALHFVHLFLG